MLFFLNDDISISVLDMVLNFRMPVLHIHLEGSLSQIFYLGPSFYFMSLTSCAYDDHGHCPLIVGFFFLLDLTPLIQEANYVTVATILVTNVLRYELITRKGSSVILSNS